MKSLHWHVRLAAVSVAAPGKGSSAKPEEEEEKPAWWRWLLVIIAMPILAILTVVGIVIWLVLLPVKIICCPIGEPGIQHTNDCCIFMGFQHAPASYLTEQPYEPGTVFRGGQHTC